ncbi:hypothetical protein TSYNTROOL_08670 [Tepidanaerobacter syntrophicus]|uniref:Inner membrane protein n=1 Tax=Tepidanaerobacter syntrophicus TaxID=224999 RepID=A0A0U9HEG1_9FIRM|nr:DUF1819 family protein [Tepidanaerobacter syntrophicus]GAQ25216.1 inner membrane protein [Tepidanaerobacter syntrophicus]GLI18706.1 hypothetical protein TSYNTROPHJE_05190 [Tepidanaerobacter syntrophicus]GLI50781.1 hypothetical protein TSYNTROOL_08670 [Tepidanaerobacter syntrophicus]HHV83699.1 DUF1819 family protein [Tepidanaerobacter syntrophicus]
MENKWKYSTRIKSQSFLYVEMKKAGRLVLQGYDKQQIRDKSLDDNIFQVNTTARKSEIASAVTKRLSVLDTYLIEKLVSSDVQTSKVIVIYSIMKTDRLFFEFMNEVYKDKIMFGDKLILDKDFNMFFDRKKEQSPNVSLWADYTFYKLKQVISRTLNESGLCKREGKKMKIVEPIVESSVTEHIKEIGDKLYINILLGKID